MWAGVGSVAVIVFDDDADDDDDEGGVVVVDEEEDGNRNIPKTERKSLTDHCFGFISFFVITNK